MSRGGPLLAKFGPQSTNAAGLRRRVSVKVGPTLVNSGPFSAIVEPHSATLGKGWPWVNQILVGIGQVCAKLDQIRPDVAHMLAIRARPNLPSYTASWNSTRSRSSSRWRRMHRESRVSLPRKALQLLQVETGNLQCHRPCQPQAPPPRLGACGEPVEGLYAYSVSTRGDEHGPKRGSRLEPWQASASKSSGQDAKG